MYFQSGLPLVLLSPGVVELVRLRVRMVSVFLLITDVMETLTVQIEVTRLIVVSLHTQFLNSNTEC